MVELLDYNEEVWKDIKGFEGIYKISNFGSVWSNHKNNLMQIKPSWSGYISVGLWKNNVRNVYRVHRLVAEHFLDNPLKLPLVDHIDGNRSNNKVSNLRWASFSINSKNQRKGGEHSVGCYLLYSEDELKNEIWVDATKKIKELSGKEFFQVSSLGRIRYYKKNNRWNTVSIQTISPKLQKSYPKTCIRFNGEKKVYSIHKLVALCFLRKPSINEVIDHKDSDICNPRLSNLQIISISENNRKANKVDDTGTNNGMSKHNPHEILTLLKMYYIDKIDRKTICRHFNMNSATVHRIIKGLTYKKLFKQFFNE